MKIKIAKANLGGFILAIAVVVAVVVIISAGAVIVKKIEKKVDGYNERRNHELTNEIESVIEDYRKSVDPRARAIYMIGVTTQDVQQASLVKVQWSTNLLSWGDLMVSTNTSIDELITETSIASNAPPQMFFRIQQ